MIKKPRQSSGYTLMELLVTLTLVAIIAAIAIPQYQGYIEGSHDSNAQNGLRTIYVQQQEHMSDNNIYYANSNGTCNSDQTNNIHTNLFNGDVILDNSNFNFCIHYQGSADNTFVARAIHNTDGRFFEIDHTNATTNF